MPNSNIIGIDHASVIVADTVRALSFYCELLELELDATRPEMDYPGAWLKVGEAHQIHLIELPNPDPVNGRPSHGGRDRHIALRVTDLTVLMEKLKQAGIDVSVSKSGRKAAFCRDYDANAVELIEK